MWMAPKPIKQLESYELTARPMRMEDVPALHPLSIGVQWPHRPEDWAMLIRLGQGVVAEDEIGRVVGSAMWWPMGPDLARICMVITTPRLQEQGAAGWLMQQIAGPIGARDKVLTATREALRLYLSLGFRPGLTVHQHQGIVAETPTVVPGARPMTAADEAAVRALDAAAFTAERRAVLNDEVLAVPRVSDIHAALPAITGKLELEYEGELKGADKVAADIIRAAVGQIFDTHLGAANLRQVVDWFDMGGSLQLDDTASALSMRACARWRSSPSTRRGRNDIVAAMLTTAAVP